MESARQDSRGACWELWCGHRFSGGDLGPARLRFPAGRAPRQPAGRELPRWLRVTLSVLVLVVAMASFVTEVLAHSGRLEKEDLGTRISRLTQRVEEIKVKPGQRAADSKGTEGGARVGLSLWGEEGA